MFFLLLYTFAISIFTLSLSPFRCAETLEVGAPVASRNSHGELPSDMCLDEATHAAFSSYQDHLFSSSRSPWNFHIGPDAEDAEAHHKKGWMCVL